MDFTIHWMWPANFRSHEVIKMKYIRGLFQSDSMVVAKPGICCEESKTRIYCDEQHRSRNVSTSSKSLTGWLHAYLQMLPILVFSLLLSVVPAVAQSTFGSVRGIVQDSSGAVLTDTQMTLHSLDENTDRKVKSDTDGNFTFENVKAGRYSLQADIDGFAAKVISGVTVAARQDVRLTVVMTVAAQTSTMDVSAGGDQLINSEDATLGDSKDNIQMTQLPLNNRATTTSPLGALGLSPNVQQDSQGNIALGGASSSMVERCRMPIPHRRASRR
jgi:hypothetical protein